MERRVEADWLAVDQQSVGKRDREGLIYIGEDPQEGHQKEEGSHFRGFPPPPPVLIISTEHSERRFGTFFQRLVQPGLSNSEPPKLLALLRGILSERSP